MAETPQVDQGGELPDATAEKHYFLLHGERLFRTTDRGFGQGRWDSTERVWKDAGDYAFRNAYLDPNPDFEEQTEDQVRAGFPGAIEASNEHLLTAFEQKASGTAPGE